MLGSEGLAFEAVEEVHFLALRQDLEAVVVVLVAWVAGLHGHIDEDAFARQVVVVDG